MTDSSRAVFLSYASQDAEAARRICEALRAAGIEVWFDQSELRGGDLWDRQIRKQIHDCALFIPIISANSQARAEGYFRREWKLAVDRTHDMSDRIAFLVPVVIDDTRDSEADVPDAFRGVQWTRLPRGEAPPPFVTRISQLFSPSQPQAQVQVPPSTVSAPASRPTPPNATASRRGRLVALLIAAVSVMAGGYVAFNKFIVSKHVAGPIVPAINPAPPAQSTIPEKSIAVLPFVDMSEKHDQEYFGDGMAEEIINLLVKIPELKVIGRTSSFQFKGKTDDLRKIGTTLGTAYVVEGSIRRYGDHVRVTAQLIDARDGTHRWSETYDREARDALSIQDEIAGSLVRALQLEVIDLSSKNSRVVARDTGAYDAYLRGLHAFNRFDEPGFDEAVANFRRAVELDPAFVPAAEQLARALCDQPSWGFVEPSVGYEQAREAAKSVLKLDAHSAIGHAVLACVHIWYDWDWAAAMSESKIAMTLAAADAFTLVMASNERMAVGRWSEAVRLCNAAMNVDPLLASVYQNISWAYLRSGRFAEAESAARRALKISPTYVGAHRDLGNALLMQGRTEEALGAMEKESLIGGQTAGLAVAYQALHRSQEARAALRRLEAERSGDMAMGIAEGYAFSGQKDQALHWLDKAYAQKDIFLWTIKGDPFFKSLEGDRRYKAFLRKMNLPE